MPSEKDLQAYQNPDLTQDIAERVRALGYSLSQDPSYTGWDTFVFGKVKLISASPGQTVFEFTVDESMCNKAGNLHGGCAATLMDNMSSTAFLTIARPGFVDAGHVSRTLSCTYLRAVPKGTTVRVVSDVVSTSKRYAHCRADLKTLDGKICVTCVHDKAIMPKKSRL